MIINNENFGFIISTTLRAAGEYHKSARYDTCGLAFDKEKGTIRIISLYFYVEISNLKIEIDVPADKPFYNVVTRSWTSIPYMKPIEYYVNKKQETYKFVGRTEYYANNIINIIGKEKEKVLDLRARYIFVQGFLPEGGAAITFENVDGKPVFSLKNVNKRFEIAKNSIVPEEYVKPGITYACLLEDRGDFIEINVVAKFGKSRSGMFVSDVMYDSKCLPRLNSLEIIHPELTECSNVLDKAENISMPPIHVGAMILYDLLKIFILCKSSKFSLHFQEEINADIWMESIPVDDEDPKVSAFLSTYDYYKNIQRG